MTYSVNIIHMPVNLKIAIDKAVRIRLIYYISYITQYYEVL